MSTCDVLVIAEAGVNHNGSLRNALELVDAAVEAQADVVKFQTFRASALVSESAPKAAYQVRQTGDAESQLQMLQRLQLSEDEHQAILAHCKERGIGFMSSPFDEHCLSFLVDELGLEQIKIGSGELTNAPLLLAAARSARRLILSTGMANLAEVQDALAVVGYGMTHSQQPRGEADFADALTQPGVWQRLRDRVILLHCTTEYPAPVEQTNLRAMRTMAQAFGLPVGYSDHTQGAEVSIAAVALGAVVIEKHLTLDRKLPGPDHAASAEPSEFKAMVSQIRGVSAALGNGIKVPSAAELPNRAIARRSLVASKAIAKGTSISAEDIAIQRPGLGRSPAKYWQTVGSIAARDYRKGEALDA